MLWGKPDEDFAFVEFVILVRIVIEDGFKVFGARTSEAERNLGADQS